MILSDKDIQNYLDAGKIKIEPLETARFRSGSYRLALGAALYKLKAKPFLDSREDKQDYEEIEIGDEGYLLQPNEFVVGCSQERLVLGDDIAALLSTRGPIAQMGLSVLLSSNFVEPGTDNHIAFEIHNVSGMPIKLFNNLSLVKAIFVKLSSAADKKGRGNDFFLRHDLD